MTKMMIELFLGNGKLTYYNDYDQPMTGAVSIVISELSVA